MEARTRKPKVKVPKLYPRKKTVELIDLDFQKLVPSLRNACDRALVLECLIALNRGKDSYREADPAVTEGARALDQALVELQKALSAVAKAVENRRASSPHYQVHALMAPGVKPRIYTSC